MSWDEALRETVTHRNFLVCAGAWTLAQTSKVLGRLLRHRQLSLKLFVGTGGMPSAHVTLVSCFAALMGRQQGVASPVFQCALVLLLITMNDAWGVRRAAGRHAVVLNRLAGARLPESLGHTPLEVFAGIALGVAMAAAFGG